MDSREKQARMLLKTVIYLYHGLDQEEKDYLDKTARELDAEKEKEWALKFVFEDLVTAFERAQRHLNDIVMDYSKEKRIELIKMVWDSADLKGYITEMEAAGIIRLAVDWGVNRELMSIALR